MIEANMLEDRCSRAWAALALYDELMFMMSASEYCVNWDDVDCGLWPDGMPP